MSFRARYTKPRDDCRLVLNSAAQEHCVSANQHLFERVTYVGATMSAASYPFDSNVSVLLYCNSRSWPGTAAMSLAVAEVAALSSVR